MSVITWHYSNPELQDYYHHVFWQVLEIGFGAGSSKKTSKKSLVFGMFLLIRMFLGFWAGLYLLLNDLEFRLFYLRVLSLPRHTLIRYPLMLKLGIATNRSCLILVGAPWSQILWRFLVLAIIIVYKGEVNLGFGVKLISSLAVFAAVLYLFFSTSWPGWFF